MDETVYLYKGEVFYFKDSPLKFDESYSYYPDGALVVCQGKIIEAGAYENAIGSWKALEKNGFKREGIIRDHGIVKNKFVNVFRYGLLKDEF